jgi:hypothetical protein
VFTVGRCDQPSPAHHDPLRPQPVANKHRPVLIFPTTLLENLLLSRSVQWRILTRHWTAGYPDVSAVIDDPAFVPMLCDTRGDGASYSIESVRISGSNVRCLIRGSILTFGGGTTALL